MIVDLRGKPYELPATAKTPRVPARKNYPAGEASRLTQGWSTSARTADQLVFQNLRPLRARSRQQYAANDYARRYINLCRTNVIGPKGVQFQCRAKDPDGGLDQRANDAVERAWKDWQKPRHFDVAGQMDGVDSQTMAISSAAIDGEVFVKLYQGRSGGKYGLAIEFIDPERIDVAHNDVLRNGNVIRFGIEYNGFNRPIAYHVSRSNESLGVGISANTGARDRIVASRIIHFFQREYVGQRRGLPWMATALKRMYGTDDYIEAAITNARVGASKMGFYKTLDGRGYVGDGQDNEGVLVQNAEPGTFEPLPPGVEFESWDPQYPSNEFDPFMKRLVRGIASGLNVSYNMLSGDLEGVNFSSIRSAVLEDREHWKLLQERFISHYMVPLYERWIFIQLMAGRIQVDGRPINPERLDRFQDVHFQPRRWSWVDPQKDINASGEEIDRGLKSKSQHIRDRGDDPAEVWREIAREKEIMEELGITSTALDPMADEQNDDEDPNDDEDSND